MLAHPHSTSSEIVYPSPFPNVLKKGDLNSKCPQLEYSYTRTGGNIPTPLNSVLIKNQFDVGIQNDYTSTTTSRIEDGVISLKLQNVKY